MIGYMQIMYGSIEKCYRVYYSAEAYSSMDTHDKVVDGVQFRGRIEK
jgi:hypothetical protein